MITYQQETWTQYYRDSQDLWEENCDELSGGRLLDPRTEIYEKLESIDKLQIITVRDNAKLIGYHISIIQPHMHHKSILCGVEDASYISKKYKFGRIRMRLLKTAEEFLRKRKIQEIYFTVNASGGTGRMMESLGFMPCSTIYNKRF